MGRSMRAEGIALTLPVIMISFPLGGALIGKYLAEWTGLPWLLYVCLILGIVGAIRESIHLVRMLNEAQK